MPPWGTVAYYFYRFRNDGTWQALHDALREKVRVAAGKEATPSAAVIAAGWQAIPGAIDRTRPGSPAS